MQAVECNLIIFQTPYTKMHNSPGIILLISKYLRVFSTMFPYSITSGYRLTQTMNYLWLGLSLLQGMSYQYICLASLTFRGACSQNQGQGLYHNTGIRNMEHGHVTSLDPGCIQKLDLVLWIWFLCPQTAPKN